MQDRDLGQNISPKKHRPFPLVIPPALAAVALTAAACGFGGEEKGQGPQPSPVLPVVPEASVAPEFSPTAILILELTPTAVVQAPPPFPVETQRNPPEKPVVTAAAELLPTVDAIGDLIRRGHQDIIFTEGQTKYYEGPEQVIQSLLNCGGPDPLILPYTFSDPEDAFVKSDDPVYFASVLGECDVVGEATKQWYQLTGKEEFLKANRLMRVYHKARFEQVIAEDPGLQSWYPAADWDFIDQELYIPLADQ